MGNSQVTGVQDLFLKVGDLVFLILLFPTSHVPLLFLKKSLSSSFLSPSPFWPRVY